MSQCFTCPFNVSVKEHPEVFSRLHETDKSIGFWGPTMCHNYYEKPCEGYKNYEKTKSLQPLRPTS